MNKELLFDSFSHLDEEFIERSEAAKPRVVWHRWAGMAACVALIAVLGLAAHQAHERARWNAIVESFDTHVLEAVIPNDGSAAPTKEAENEWRESVENFEPATIESAVQNDGENGGPIASGPAFMPPDNSTPTEYTNIKPMIEYYNGLHEMIFHETAGNGCVEYSALLDAAMREYGDSARYRVVVELFRDGQPLDVNGDEAAAERERLAALGYMVAFESLYDHGVLEQSWLTLHATYDQLKNFAASDSYGYMLYLYAERVPDYEPDMPAVFSPGSIVVDEEPADVMAVTPPAPQSETLTRAAALGDADFGAYLCGEPAGFGEREYRRYDDSLQAYFRGGYDYVEWRVSHIDDYGRARVTSVADTENYDLALYPIPRADSVPAGKREIVDNPVFRAEELTLDTVYKRAYKVDDAGDADGWRMEFSVLYGGDIVVSVTAKGVSPEWVYQQLEALR